MNQEEGDPPTCRNSHLGLLLSTKYLVVYKVARLWNFVTAALIDGDETTCLANCLAHHLY